MSVNSIERVLWELTEQPQKVGDFVENTDAYLAAYQLTQEDCRMIKERDVRAMADYGVSQMLLMLFWQTVTGGPAQMGEYMQRMNTPA